jgi:hypothetical protein
MQTPQAKHRSAKGRFKRGEKELLETSSQQGAFESNMAASSCPAEI